MSETKPEQENLGVVSNSYDQIQKMAIGGMAEIYRARQKSLDRPVAIKRIRPELRLNKDIQERFRREAKSSANLLHQNLAHVYDYISSEQDAFIIMEWIDGFDLAEVLERTKKLPIDVAIMISIKVLHGLSYVHSHGMVHRDLKPDNIRLSTRGEVKIMDFGIALDPSDQSLTLPGTLVGSPHYLAPEQILGGKLDAKVDIFAFGITLYEILTGKKPFFETQNESIYARIQKGEYIPPQNINPEIPSFLETIIESCLHIKPARRPKSVDEIAASLTQFLATNYSSENETRVRQYLIQSSLMHGNANLIEVVEKTSGTGLKIKWHTRLMQLARFYFSRRIRTRTVVLIALLSALAVYLYMHTKANVMQTPESGHKPASLSHKTSPKNNSSQPLVPSNPSKKE